MKQKWEEMLLQQLQKHSARAKKAESSSLEVVSHTRTIENDTCVRRNWMIIWLCSIMLALPSLKSLPAHWDFWPELAAANDSPPQ